jgi:carbamoylphosphate synthase large subunit
MKERILVTGVGGPAGRATTTFLQNNGFSVIGTDIVPVTTPVDDFHIVSRADDPAFPGALLDLIRHERPAIVIPTVSEELPHVARMKNAIRDLDSRVFISDPIAVDCVNDKLTTANFLQEKGVRVPRTLSSNGRTVAARIKGEVGYPCIAKPRVGRGGRGVALYRFETEAVRDTRPDVVWQEFMSGEECDINLFAYPAGRVKSMAVLQKTVLKNGIVGNALSVQRVIRRDMAELGLQTAEVLRLEGPIDIDIRRDGNGVPHVLEVNARVGANVLSAPEVLEELLATAYERN